MGTEAPELMPEKIVRQQLYSPVMRPICKGKFSLIRLGIKTLNTVMPRPVKNMPKKRPMVPKNERMSRQAMRIRSHKTPLRICQIRSEREGTRREKTAKEKRGMLVSSPARLLEMDKSCWISPTRTPMAVMGPRMLHDRRRIPAARNHELDFFCSIVYLERKK